MHFQGVSMAVLPDNDRKAVFTISSNSTTIGGAFVTTNNTKGGSTGTLYGGGAFSAGDKTIDDNDTLTVTVTLTATAMGVWCDGTRYEMETARQVDALRRAVSDWPRRCWADYGWCEACQVTWMDAHP